MGEAQNTGGIDTGNQKLQQLKRRVQQRRTHPELSNVLTAEQEVRNAFTQIAAELKASESKTAPMGIVHAQLLQTEGDKLSDWIAHLSVGRRLSQQPLIHPRSPYVRSEGEAPLQGYALSTLQHAPDSMRMWNVFFRVFEADLPEGQSFETFLAHENIRAAFQVADEINDVSPSWTFHTKIPGVALHVEYEYPKEGEPVRGSNAQVKLAFEPHAIGMRSPTESAPRGPVTVR